MNWRITELDHRSIVSFSDAHSGPKLGREATVFDLSELSFDAIRDAIMSASMNHEPRTMNALSYTIEFYPEEGKYHYTGHRNCGISWGPEETKTKGTTCPVCHKPLTQGVMQRVEELAGRDEATLRLESGVWGKEYGIDAAIKVIRSGAFPNRPPFVMFVPLQEIIAEAVESMPTSQKVQSLYDTLVSELGGEFSVLLKQPLSAITRLAGEKVADGIDRVRRGDITIDPGYDGVFGKVKIWDEESEKKKQQETKEQLALF
jgi:PHP family Zn ribbon phosphoesterase